MSWRKCLAFACCSVALVDAAYAGSHVAVMTAPRVTYRVVPHAPQRGHAVVRIMPGTLIAPVPGQTGPAAKTAVREAKDGVPAKDFDQDKKKKKDGSSVVMNYAPAMGKNWPRRAFQEKPARGTGARQQWTPAD